MYVYAKPGTQVDTYLEGASPGLVGTVAFQLVDDSNEEVLIPRTIVGITEVPVNSGTYHKKIEAPSKSGTYSLTWDNGTLGPETSATDILVVTGALPPGEKPDLVTLEQVKIAKGENPADHSDPNEDKAIEQAIEEASAAIRNFTQRDFGIPLVTESRQFEYEGDNFVEIDDAHEIDEVAFKFGTTRSLVTTFYWRAEPQNGPPYTYLTIPHWANAYSPEMGFTYNLDVFSRDHGWPGLIPLVEVTGTWGWAETPADVQRAAIITAIAFQQDPSSYVSESIAGYSYTTALREGTGAPSDLTPTAIPGKAQDLLQPYIRFTV
jgi:hypothetical protein